MSAAFVKVVAELGLLDDDNIPPTVNDPHPLITERAVDAVRRLKVIYVGAGVSGIVAGIKFQQLPYVDLAIYEKNVEVGGTWFENIYPGVACDLAAHAYQLTFESNPAWTTFFASGQEILQYWKRVVEKYNMRKLIKFSHECIEAKWIPTTSKWLVTFRNLATGELIQDTADVFITGIGVLNKWKMPNIRGLEDFRGQVLHTAHWDSSFDPVDKDIALIGSGSSGIQVLPQIQPLARKVDHYIRSPTWIASTVRHEELMKRGDLGNFEYSKEEIDQWLKDPSSYVEYRRYLEANLQGGFNLVQRGSKEQRGIRKLFELDMRKRLAQKPEVADRLIPLFSPICKRLTPGPGYLEALSSQNVKAIQMPISHIDETGVITSDGLHHPADAIICATGFDTTFLGTFPVYGRNGVQLQKKRQCRHQSYLSVGIDEFPNFFQVLGPNGGLGNGNLIVMIEYITDYLAKCLEKLATQCILTMEPKKHAVDNFTDFCEAFHKRTVFSEECQSWYKTVPEDGTPEEKKRGRVTAIWPGSSLHACRVFQTARFEDYDFTFIDSNEFAWIGNGWTYAERTNDVEGRVYYLNNDMKFVNDDLPTAQMNGRSDCMSATQQGQEVN